MHYCVNSLVLKFLPKMGQYTFTLYLFFIGLSYFVSILNYALDGSATTIPFQLSKRPLKRGCLSVSPTFSDRLHRHNIFKDEYLPNKILVNAIFGSYDLLAWGILNSNFSSNV